MTPTGFVAGAGTPCLRLSAPALDGERSETGSVEWQDTLNYRLVLHSPEVRRLVEDAAGTTKGRHDG